MITALSEFKQIVNPDVFGLTIGHGMNTIAILPYENIGKDVLIFTKEKQKFHFLTNLLPKDFLTSVNTIYLDKDSYNNFKLMEDENWYFFFMKRFNKVDIQSDENLISTFHDINLKYGNLNSEEINIDEIHTEIYELYLLYSGKEEIEGFALNVINSIVKSLNIIKELKIDNFKLDFHEEQFGEINNEIFCFDPVMFDLA